MRLRTVDQDLQARANDVSAERAREYIIVSVLVANYLHDARLLDPNAVSDEVSLTVDTILDGDIPVRIQTHKNCYGPARIEWHLWPDEPGRRTWGTMSVGRLSVTKAIFEAGSYDRSRKRSPRLAKIPLPDAKWGLSSTDFKRLGIDTTF